MMQKKIYIESAVKIGIKFLNESIWSEDKCTWKVKMVDLKERETKKIKEEYADHSFYQGLAGIALYLSTLYKYTFDEKFKKLSIGSLNNIIELSDRGLKKRIGFYDGIIGTAYALIKCGIILEKEEYCNKGTELLDQLFSRYIFDGEYDVIGGAAGSIPFLIKLYTIRNENKFLDWALQLGDNLVENAQFMPFGWSWAGKEYNIGNLCGFGHGAAGIGHALLELYNITNSDYYLFAAEQSFNYERNFFNKNLSNWADLRQNELSKYIYTNRVDEFKRKLNLEGIKPAKHGYMSAWCHGAPGIGLSRLRAYEITDKTVYKNELLNAITNSIESLEKQQNYSLCHGIFGICETLYETGFVLSDSTLINLCYQKADEGILKFDEKCNWPGGILNHLNDSSFMLGDAGIGYFLLRLYDKNLESIIGPKTHQIKNIRHVGRDSIQLKSKYAQYYFGDTLKNLDRYLNSSDNIYNKVISKTKQTDNSSYNSYYLKEIIKELLEEYGINEGFFKEIFDIDILKIEMILNVIDYSADYCKKLMKIDFKKYYNRDYTFTISENVKLYSKKFYWDENSNCIQQLEEKVPLLFQRVGNKIIEHKLEYLSHLVINSISENNLQEIESNILELIECNFDDHSEVKNIIKEQIFKLYDDEIIDIKINK